jgi:hypothetical protein
MRLSSMSPLFEFELEPLRQNADFILYCAEELSPGQKQSRADFVSWSHLRESPADQCSILFYFDE